MKGVSLTRTCSSCGGPISSKNISGVCIKVLECKRENRRLNRERNFENEDAARRLIYQSVEGRARSMYASAKQRAKRDGVPFDIAVEDLFPFPECCPVFGVEFDLVNPRSARTPQLDKLVPHKGYVRGNIAIISTRANRLKSDASLLELRRIADWMEERGYRE